MTPFSPFASDDEVVAIGIGLLARTLPRSAWTHAAHFAATLWILTCRPDLDVSNDLPSIIRSYNESTGVANTDSSGYHETITQASLRAASAFHAERAGPLFVVCNDLMASPLGRSDWPLVYWSRDRLFSSEARRRWIDPDIKPLPF